MELKDALVGWLSNVSSMNKSAQSADSSDPDPVMPAGRLLIDSKATRQSIFDLVKESVSKRFPIENDNYRIELRDVGYEGPTDYSLEQQKQAILHNRKLRCSLMGTWRLIDRKTGNVLEEKRDSVMRVPYYTNRGTIINNGSEYTVISQARLSPGVYTRKKQNGDLETQFNVANGKGFKLELNKETGKMGIRMGQANLPLYPILKAFGVTDQQMGKAWGNDIALVNSRNNDPNSFQKFYEKVAGYKYDPMMTPEGQANYVKDELSKFGLDPYTVVRTLGLENVKGVTPEVLLRASQKLLNVNRGIEEQDNRDNPRFSKFYGIEHMLKERIDKDSAKLLKPMLFKVGRDKSLTRVGRNALGPYIDDFLSTSGLAQPGEEANPMSILVQQSRITRMGEGGISSPDLVTTEARGVQGDYLGFVDNISGPESSAAGIDVRGSFGTVLGKDNRLYNIFRNMRTGKKEYLSLDSAADKVIAFPDQDPKAPYMYCMKNGVPTKTKTSEVDYIVPSFSRTISAGINLNPTPTAVFGARSFYSSKFWEQYLPQKTGEVPFVDSLMPDGKMTFNEYYGRRVGCLTAPFSGTVSNVTKDSITVTGRDGKKASLDIVSNFPYNRMSGISYFPLVKKGMEVKEGDILAHSNFTDPKTGAFNMGHNLKVAVLPGSRGSNSFEDAIIISEDAAKKMATSRLYNFEQDTRNGVSISKNKFLAAFPKEFTKDQADKLDESGVVKVGTELHRGDPIVVATGPKLLSAENAQLGRLSSVLKNAVTNKSQVWNHDWPGIVTDVVSGPNGAKVLIKSEPPVKVGDKLSGRYALKGVTGTVLPMEKMPRDAVTNEPYDMLVNPMGFLSRVAPGQLMEIALGKVAKKTGRQIRIPQMPPEGGWLNWTKKQLADAGLSETADVFDPQTGRTIRGVGDGYMFVQAMHHLAEKKYSARGLEGGYTQDQQPAKGGITGSKKISGFDVNALLSHGATEVLKDAMTVRGTNNEQYWRQLRLGLPIPEPGVPFIYEKFLNNLKAGGINVVERGDITSIMPQTDRDIEKLSEGRIIDSSQMVDSDFDPVKGGLFDLSKTGGMGGTRWSMIELPEPVPNPVMEEPIRRILGLTSKGLANVISGRDQLNGKTGGEAIREALAKVNADTMMVQARTDIKTKRGSVRDNAVKVLGYLKAAKEMNISPADWMISKVPVLPPAFRPISKVGDVALVPDTNELYKELLESKHNYEILKEDLPDSALTDERLNVYKAVKAAFGLGNSVTTEGQAKNLKGPIKQIIGTVPKWGQYQSKVVAKNQDLVGRSVTVPDKNLSMDQIGIPEDMAWTMYKPFVTRQLVLRGYSPVDSVKMIEDRTPTAKHILQDLMKEKPVLMDRAPTWHKFNIMAFKPFIVEGKEIRVSPLIDSGFNMDHDGNCVDYDSVLTVRLSKSALDVANEICDTMLHTNQEKEYAMTDANASIRIIGNDQVEMNVKIGTFPRMGIPELDKNGARMYQVPEGIKVLSVDPVTGVRSFEPVTMFTHESVCDTVKVSYGSKSVIVSSNESLAVFDNAEGHLVRVKPVAEEKRLTPVLVSSSENFGSFGDRDLGWLFGAFISDGWSSDRMVGYTKLEKNKRDEFVRILRSKHENFNLYEYEGRKNNGKLGESVKIHCNGASVANWLHQWKFVHDDVKNANGKRTALYKMIDPVLIESGSEAFLWGLLSGMLDGDGNIVCNTARKNPRYSFRINTSSTYLRDDLFRLCHKLGLRYSVTTVKARGWSNESYVVMPSTVDVFAKIDHLSCIGVDECQRIEDLKKSGRIPADTADMIPVSNAELEAMRTMPSFKTGCPLYVTLLKTRKQGAMRGGRENLMAMIDDLKANEATAGLAERVLNTNTKWMQISAVESAGVREVFDLEVATTKTFVINDGVVVWDTANIHVPASEKASREALNKMLPSKNILSLTDMTSVRYKPEKEQVSGLWALTSGVTHASPRRFESKSDAIKAYRSGEIGPNDPVIIKE